MPIIFIAGCIAAINRRRNRRGTPMRGRGGQPPSRRRRARQSERRGDEPLAVRAVALDGHHIRLCRGAVHRVDAVQQCIRGCKRPHNRHIRPQRVALHAGARVLPRDLDKLESMPREQGGPQLILRVAAKRVSIALPRDGGAARPAFTCARTWCVMRSSLRPRGRVRHSSKTCRVLPRLDSVMGERGQHNASFRPRASPASDRLPESTPRIPGDLICPATEVM